MISRRIRPHFYAKDLTVREAVAIYHIFLSSDERNAWVSQSPYRVYQGGRLVIASAEGRQETKRKGTTVIRHFEAHWPA